MCSEWLSTAFRLIPSSFAISPGLCPAAMSEKTASSRSLSASMLLQLEDSAAYNLTVDFDVDAVRAHSECTRTEIVDVLAAVDPEVRARVGGAAINGLVDLSGRTPGRSGHSNSGWRQVTCGSTVEGQSELHRHDPAP